MLLSPGQHPHQSLELALPFLLFALIGFERELRRKSAGLRTYTLVGTTAALFLLVSNYGFDDVLSPGRIVLDPSRVAAQIVTGIGFTGAGVIFTKGDRVKGLATAATVWLVTAIGMACVAGLPLLAIAVTAAYFVVGFLFPRLMRLAQPTRSPRTADDANHDGHSPTYRLPGA